MPARSGPAQLLARPLLRRLITVGATFVAGIVLVPLSPILIGAGWLRDRLTRNPESPTARLLMLVVGSAAIELVGMALTLIVMARRTFGMFHRSNGSADWRHYRWLMGWYTATQLRFICWVLRAPIEWRDHAPLDDGPIVLIARHTSFFDALIPGALLAHRNRLLPHHVLAAGLQFAPLIDIVGHQFPNRFIARDPGASSEEIVPIERLGAVLTADSGCVIFPEGTFRSPKRFARSLASLSRNNPERADQARLLEHTLPPRPSGLWALLQGCPEADVVVCTNTGFERFGFATDIARNMPSRAPITIETWRVPRTEIPTEFEPFTDWLFREFARVDAWVSAQA